jgi:hypothetical protein
MQRQTHARYFNRLVFSDVTQAVALLGVANYFKWPALSILKCDAGEGLAAALSRLAQEYGVEIDVTASFSDGNGWTHGGSGITRFVQLTLITCLYLCLC